MKSLLPIAAVASMAFLPALAQPLHAAILHPVQGTYLRSNANGDANFGGSEKLELANRSSAFRKAYLQFDLTGQLAPEESFANASLTLTAWTTPLIGSATGSVTFSIYGFLENTAWSETTLTWNNSGPLGNDGTPTGVDAAATTFLGTFTVNSNTVSSGDAFTLTGTALTTYLNWAGGKLGDYYGTGETANLTPTFILTAAGTTLNDAGISFNSPRVTTEALRPALTFDAIPEPGCAILMVGGAFAFLALRKRNATR